MEEYTSQEFINLYGKFPTVSSWLHVVSVTKQGYNVTVSFHNGYIIRFPIVFHEGTWVVHGIAQYPRTKKYYHFGKLHRQGAPAHIRISNNIVRYQAYCWNNRFHRDGDEPAICIRTLRVADRYRSVRILVQVAGAGLSAECQRQLSVDGGGRTG